MGGVVVDEGPGGVKAPDGGWGWAVLSGCFIITGFSYAFPKAVSVFFKELIREFGVGYSDTAWISSILLAMLYGTGPLCSVLVNRYGCRPVMMVGGLFASLGMILSSFSTSIIHIYLSTGVITGLGLALNFQPSLIMLNRYFSEKRPLANGLAAAGSPVALCCLSPLGQVVLAAVVLATCNFLFIRKKPSEPATDLENGTVATETEQLNKPVAAEEEEEEEKGEKEKEDVKEEAVEKAKEDEEEEIRPESVMVDSEEVERFLKEPEEQNGAVLQYQYGWRGGFLILGGLLLNCCACAALMRPLVAPPKPPPQLELEDRAKEADEVEVEKAPSQPKPLLDFTVFKDRGFLIYTIAASIMVLGLFVPPVFVVSYAKELGNEDTKSALLLSILGFIDIFARPTCGIIAGMKWVRPRVVYLFSFSMLFNGCTDLVGSQAKDYSSLVVFCVFFGVSYGMVGALQFEVLMTIVGTEKFSSAIGLVLLMEAIAVLVGPPGAGRLLDATKNYMYVFLLAGTEVVLAAVVLATCNFLFIRKKPSEPATDLENGTVATETEQLNKPVAAEEEEEEEKGEKEKEDVKEEAVEKAKEDEEEEIRPESVMVDSEEVERFLKEPEEQNGAVLSSSETRL